MGLLDLFRSAPKPCTSCRAEFPKLHGIWSGLRGGEETDRLCTSCWTERLGREIRGKQVLFFEPMVVDSYCFTPLDELENDFVRDRIVLALESLGPKCARCSSRPVHLWLPLDDTDEEEMNMANSRSRTHHWFIPSEPARWTGAVALCDQHLPQHLRAYLEEKRDTFLTFRFPDSSASGAYW